MTAVAVDAAADPDPAYSQAYRDAVAYLRAHGGEAFADHAAQGVILPEAVGADPLVAGPRSGSVLASLELSSPDARSRRARVVLGLGLDASADHDPILDFMGDPENFFDRPVGIQVHDNGGAGTYRSATPPPSGYGELNMRMPNALDRALALQALFAFRAVDGDNYVTSAFDSILFLLEFRVDGPGEGWPLVRDGDSEGAGATSDVSVTAEVVIALDAWEPVWNYWGFPNPDSIDEDLLSVYTNLPIATQTGDLAGGLAAGTSFLVNATTPANAIEAAMRLLALLERLPGNDPVLASAHTGLLGMQETNPNDPAFGSFDGSVFATALAARAILRAAQLHEFAFDTDDDGIADGPDPDSDDDDYCDPGESGAGCSLQDRFPLEQAWYTDSDNDGLADEDPNETDVDGDGVPDTEEPPAFAGDARESVDTNGDGQGDTADPDDDGDGLNDIDELLLGLDPVDSDTDGDSFRDLAEVDAGTDGLNPNDYPDPDGDIYPLGAPDGVTDLRDVLFAFRILSGDFPGAESEPFFMRHGDVAPLTAGAPQPDETFDAGDAFVILQRVSGEIAIW